LKAPGRAGGACLRQELATFIIDEPVAAAGRAATNREPTGNMIVIDIGGGDG